MDLHISEHVIVVAISVMAVVMVGRIVLDAVVWMHAHKSQGIDAAAGQEEGEV